MQQEKICIQKNIKLGGETGQDFAACLQIDEQIRWFLSEALSQATSFTVMFFSSNWELLCVIKVLSSLESHFLVTYGWCLGCHRTFCDGYIYIYGLHAPGEIPSKTCSRLNAGLSAFFLSFFKCCPASLLVNDMQLCDQSSRNCQCGL